MKMCPGVMYTLCFYTHLYHQPFPARATQICIIIFGRK